MPTGAISEIHPEKKKNSSVDTRENVSHHTIEAQFKQAISGAVAGCVTRFLTQPFDVLKIRFQLQVEPVGQRRKPGGSNSKYTSIWQACGLIYKEEGLHGLWKGHNAGQFMSIIYALMQFWSYEQIHINVRQIPSLVEHQNLAHFISGSLAGCVGTFFAMPFDVIRTRLVAQDPGAGYKTVWHAIPVIFRNEGIQGYFRGLGTTLIQIGPLVGGNFMFYNFFNELTEPYIDLDGRWAAWLHLANGGIAGVASKAAVYPLDFIKKRLQLRGFEKARQTYGQNQDCSSVMNCIKLTIRHEGVLGFYKGMAPTLLKSGMTTAFYFSIYDEFRKFLSKEETILKRT